MSVRFPVDENDSLIGMVTDRAIVVWAVAEERSAGWLVALADPAVPRDEAAQVALKDILQSAAKERR